MGIIKAPLFITDAQGARVTGIRNPDGSIFVFASGTVIEQPTVVAPVGNMIGGDRLLSNEKFPTGSTGLRQAVFKREAEAQYTKVRVWILNKTTAAPLPTFEAFVASTEDGRVDTVARAFSPMIGGATDNARWQRLKWGGADTVTPPITAGSGQSIAGYSVSDWLDLPSIGRTDAPGGRPMAVLRVNQLTASAAFVGGSANSTQWHLGRGQPWYREEMSQTAPGADVTSYPVSLSANFDDPIACWLEFSYSVPARNMLIVGDSREASAASLYGSDSWWRRALKAKSTAAAPICGTNCSGSGHSQIQFLKLATDLINAGWQGTDVLVPGFSQNGFGTAATNGTDFIARNRVFLDLCISKGLKIYLTTDYAVNGYAANSNQENGRQACIAEAKRLASIGQVTLVDTDAVISDYVTDPALPVMKSMYNTTGASGVEGAAGSGDGIHCGPSGQVQMGNLLASLL